MNDTDDYSKLIEQLDSLRKSVALMMSTVKKLQKYHNKHAKRLKNVKSGFTKPVKISEPLRKLIKAEEGELIARCVVNKRINDYIKTNNLQTSDNRQQFVIDEALASVFNVSVGTVVHFFQMQTYLKAHYPKDAI